MKAVNVYYRYRSVSFPCGCCSEDGSYVEITNEDGSYLGFEEFGMVIDEIDLKERLLAIGVEFADNCNFSECEYF